MKSKIYGTLCVLGVLSAPSAFAGPCDTASLRDESAQITAQADSLTLTDVVSAIRLASPNVRIAALERAAYEAEALQARRWNNPTLTIGMEDFGGSNSLSGFDQSESSISVSQALQLGGKRSKRGQAAAAQAALASAECSVILRETELQAALIYTELLALYDLHALASETVDLASKLQDVADKRVEAGAAAPPGLSRARAERSKLEAETASIAAEIDHTKVALARFWGNGQPQFESISALELTSVPDSEPDVSGDHPLIRRAEAAQSAWQAETRYQSALAVPDLELSLGVKRFEATDEQALIAEIGVPLPIFDRNQDGVHASSLRQQGAMINRRAVEQQLLGDIRSTISALRSAQQQVEILEDQTVPEARVAYDASVRGYEVGRFSLTDTLDARRSLIEVEVALIEARRAQQSETLRLSSLVGAAPFSKGGDNE